MPVNERQTKHLILAEHLRKRKTEKTLRIVDRVALCDLAKVLSDREGHGHKAVVYKSHFPPLRDSVVTETPADTLANKPHLQAKTLFVLYAPTTWWQLG